MGKIVLPAPACQIGYTHQELVGILGKRVVEFDKWMAGQTIVICDGWQYDPKRGFNVTSGCGPHGAVVYSWDLGRFLEGRPIVD